MFLNSPFSYLLTPFLKGETEFYADGTFVHIRNADSTKEWQEFKLGANAKRQRSASALPSEWDSRKLSNLMWCMRLRRLQIRS